MEKPMAIETAIATPRGSPTVIMKETGKVIRKD